MANAPGTITPRPAVEPGAVNGFEVTCPDCEMVLTNTFQSSLEVDYSEHQDWHARKFMREHVQIIVVGIPASTR